jgi:endonuclease/exonuclease/phosphatase family metal-dependent hydrolase
MRLRSSLCVFLLLFVALPCGAQTPEFIKLASFNIAEFGEGSHPKTRDLDYIASLLIQAELDLIAIQKVGVKKQAEDQLSRLVDLMNQKEDSGSPHYFFSITPVSGDERCAVIYRFPVTLEDELVWLDEDKDPERPNKGGKTYYRIPVAIPFEAGNFDFMVVIVHLAYSNLQKRVAEVSALKDFLRKKDPTEDDWIVLGDMNRYAKYAKGTANKAFDKLLKSDWESRYRFPLLEAVTHPNHDMRIYRAPKDAYSTTIAQKTDIYDQIIITQGAFRELGTDDPTMGQEVGIIAFDMQAPLNAISDHNTVKYRVSDHRPIWIRLRIDLPDDD